VFNDLLKDAITIGLKNILSLIRMLDSLGSYHLDSIH